VTTDREFVSETIEPDPGSWRVAEAATGEPALPGRFVWRGRTYEIEAIERTWKTTDAGVHHVGDTYLRRHWADVRTACGARLRLYGERGGRPRWFLHSRLR